MTSNTLSHLSKGYGSWTGGYVDPYFGEKRHKTELSFPEIDHETHVHGITVGSRSGRSTAMSWARRSREQSNDQIPLPKTYTTRKGALQIYVAPDDIDSSSEEEEALELKPQYVKRPHGKELIDLSLKLGTMERLAMSVLQFGDQDYDHEHTSVSDAKNKAFLKFLRSVDHRQKVETDVDRNVQPGGDLHSYLRDLKSSASSRNYYSSDGSTYLPKSRESLELQAILRGLDNSGWPLSYPQDGLSDRQSTGQFTRPVSRVSSRGPSPGPPSTPRSTFQVLSAKKVAESIKSGGYLGRPGSRVSAHEDEVQDGEVSTSPQHITSASVSRRQWTPTESMDKPLLDGRGSFFWDPNDEGDSDDKKRMTNKEFSFASGLYPGRNARKGEGQSVIEVKATGKGDGDSSQGKGQGHRMSQIVEEKCDGVDNARTLGATGDGKNDVFDDDDNDNWAIKVADAENFSRQQQEKDDKDHINSDRSGIIDIEIDEKHLPQKETLKVRSRPGSDKSVDSNSSITSNPTASIITIQKFTASPQPPVEEKMYTPYKRKSFSYDPEKSKRRNSLSRKSVHVTESKHVDEDVGISIAAPTPEGGSPLYSAPKYMYGASMNWNVNEATDIDVPDNADQEMQEEHLEQKDVMIEETKSIHSEVGDRTGNLTETGQNENEFIGSEEDILDNIHECNEEIKQIEAQAESAYESDSDSSVMDEEVIKVILGNQGDDEQKSEYQVEEKNEYRDQDPIEGEEDVDDTIEEHSETGTVSRKQSLRRQSLRRQSAIDAQGEGDIEIKEGDDLESVELKAIEQEDETVEVDEERLSEVRSLKSHKTSLIKSQGRSKRSKSGAGSEEEYIGEEEVQLQPNTELTSILPVLESDLYDIHQESQKEKTSEAQLILENQTGFSGSTDSYSDMLASNKNSRPVSAISSRPVSAGISRRSSAKPSPTTSAAVSRPASAKSSKPQSVQGSRPSSARISRPASINLSRPSSRPSSARPASAKISRPGSTLKESRSGSAADFNDQNDEVPPPEIDTLVQKLNFDVDNLTDTVQRESELDARNDIVEKEPVGTVNEPAETKIIEKAVKPEEIKQKAEPEPVESKPIVKVEEKKPEIALKAKPDDILKTGARKQSLTNKVAPAKQQPRKTSLKETAPQPRIIKGSPQKVVANNKGLEKQTDKKQSNKTVASSKLELSATGVDKPSNLKVESGDGGNKKLAELTAETSILDASGEGLVSDRHGNIAEGDTENGDAHSIVQELDALGLRKPTDKKKGKKEASTVYPLLPPAKRPKAPPEKAKIPDHIAEALKRQPGASIQRLEEDLERMTELANEHLAGPTLEAVGEGLTEEELELAKMLLQQKLDEAKGKLNNQEVVKPVKKKAPAGKAPAKGKGKGKKAKSIEEEKTPDELDRDAIRAKHEEEKRIRDEEKADLQRQIAEKKALLQAQNDMSSAESRKLREKMEELEREAEDLMRAEDEARSILAELRKQKRDEREARRKADLEKKKQDAQMRREREKKEMDEKRKKESDMLEKIADAEMRRLAREEEERRADEEERIAQERFEAELLEAQRHEEEEEERLKEIERQAEEEAMQKLIEEREAAERERRRLREQEEFMFEEERKKQEIIEEQERKLQAERQKIEDLEDAKRERERQNYLELLRLEEEGRRKIQEELENKRSEAIARRDYNLENFMHIDKLKNNQGITRAWTFSYFVQWPRETYERPIGDPDPRKVVKIKNPKPKKVDPSPETGTDQLTPQP